MSASRTLPDPPATPPDLARPVVGIDPRGPRFAAVLTTVVLAVALLLVPGPVGVALVLAQGAVFAVGALLGVAATPYAILFRAVVRPRLAPPAELEAPQPPRFAQAVGLVFVAVAALALLLDAVVLAQVALGFALAAAFLNAAFGFCLGCELYLLLARLRGGPRHPEGARP